MGRMFVKGFIAGLAAACSSSCSGEEQQQDSQTPTSTNEPAPIESSAGAPVTSASSTEETAGSNTLALPEGFAPVEATVFKPFPDACDTISEQKCNGSCVSPDGEVNGCAFVNSSVIWRGIVNDEQGTYVGQGGSTSNSILHLDPSQHRLAEFGSFAGTQSDSFDMALDSENVYVTVAQELVAFPRNGGPMRVVAPDFPSVSSLIVVDDVAYGEVSGEEELLVFPLNGEPSTTVPFEGDSLIAAAPDFFYTQEGAVYRATGGDVVNATIVIDEAPNSVLGVRGEWLYGLRFANNVYELHRWPKVGGSGELVQALSSRAGRLAADRLLFACPSDEAEFVCSFNLDGDDPRVHGYLPPGAPAISVLVADDQYVYAGKGTVLARFHL